MDVRLDSLSILGLKGHMWPMWSWKCGLKKIIFTEDMVVKTHSWFNDEHSQSSCKVLRAETQHSQRQKRDLHQTTFVKSLRPSSGQRKPRGARSQIMGARPGWSLTWRLCIIIFFSPWGQPIWQLSLKEERVMLDQSHGVFIWVFDSVDSGPVVRLIVSVARACGTEKGFVTRFQEAKNKERTIKQALP